VHDTKMHWSGFILPEHRAARNEAAKEETEVRFENLIDVFIL